MIIRKLLRKFSDDQLIKSLAILNHLLLLYGFMFHLSWISCLIGIIIYWIIVTFGISIGYHRYYTHKSFETNKLFQLIFLILGSLAFLGPVISWAGVHRTHHAYSDTTKDPHSPINGFFRTWLHLFRNKNIAPRFVIDLIKNPYLKIQQRWYFDLIILYLCIGYIIFLGNAIFLISLPAVLMYHVTGMVNSLNHTIGEKLNNDNSTNIPCLSWITGGESYHANHHKKTNEPVFGSSDPAKWIIPWIQL